MLPLKDHSSSRISGSVAFFNVQVHNTSKLLSTEIEDGQQGDPLLQIHLFPQFPAVRRSNIYFSKPSKYKSLSDIFKS